MRKHRKLRALLGLLMVFTLLAAACGDDDGDEGSGEGEGEGTEETSDLSVGLA